LPARKRFPMKARDAARRNFEANDYNSREADKTSPLIKTTA